MCEFFLITFHCSFELKFLLSLLNFKVIVSDEITATQLLERGQLRRRVTIIPLNKIQGSEIPEHVSFFLK